MLQFQNTFSIGDVVNALIFLGALIALWISVSQARAGGKTQRATYFQDLYLKLFGDDLAMAGLYLVDDNKFTYETDSFRGSDTEKKIDRLLFTVDLICALWEQKLIDEREMSYFTYAFSTIYKNPGIQDYLAYLTNNVWPQYVGKGAKPFASFVSYCTKTLKLPALA